MLDLDQAMSPADHVDAHGAANMRVHWRPLALLVAACERRAVAICKRASMVGPYYHGGCRGGHHVAGCAVTRADADIAAALAVVHAVGQQAGPDGGRR